MKLLPVVLDGFAKENNVGFSQDCCWTERAELLGLVQDTCKARVSVAEASIGKAELRDGRQMRVFKHVQLTTVLG